MKLNATHAYPWRMAIASMTGKGIMSKPSDTRTAAATANKFFGTSLSGIHFMSNDWQAKLIRHYPRTEAEVNSNASITRKIKR